MIAANELSILIVDDSMVYRKIFSDAARLTGRIASIHAASDGFQALDMLSRFKYDLVVLDVIMPGIDGLATMDIISRRYPDLPVIMVSTSSPHEGGLASRALQSGALDFLLKPREASPEKNIRLIADYLTGVIERLAGQRLASGIKTAAPAAPLKSSPQVLTEARLESPGPASGHDPSWLRKGPDMVVIAASTGGPGALKKVFQGITTKIMRPFLVVQHMAAGFTRSLAENLDKESGLQVREASDKEEVLRGLAYIAPGSIHMKVGRNEGGRSVIELEDSAYVNGVKPSADVLLYSIARNFPGIDVLVVVMTGMGADGTAGVRELKNRCNCYCITQSEASSVVYGMPRAVYEAGLSDQVLGLEFLSRRINQLCSV